MVWFWRLSAPSCPWGMRNRAHRSGSNVFGFIKERSKLDGCACLGVLRRFGSAVTTLATQELWLGEKGYSL
jgi:hypothetical protein